jgi:hypothetical protein
MKAKRFADGGGVDRIVPPKRDFNDPGTLFDNPNYRDDVGPIPTPWRNSPKNRVKDLPTSAPTTPPINPRQQAAKGGKITRVAGKPIGKEDGLIAAQKGEYVIKKAAVKKLGSGVLNTINKGKLPTKAKGR